MQQYLSSLRGECQREPYKQVPSMKNNRIERWWVEMNRRVGYPIKYCLLDLEREDREFTADRQNPHHLFSIGVISRLVAEHGATVTKNAWNAHTIPSHGKPKDFLSGNKATKLIDQQLPSVQAAVEMYEQTGGILTRENSTGEDLLAAFPNIQAQRDNEFFDQILPQIGTIPYIFGCVVNHQYSPLQTAIIEHIKLTSVLFENAHN